jgi:hypothetical protein
LVPREAFRATPKALLKMLFEMVFERNNVIDYFRRPIDPPGSMQHIEYLQTEQKYGTIACHQ